LFVSHNLVAVEGLCSRAILLNAGKLAYDDGVKETLTEYMGAISTTTLEILGERKDRSGNGRLRLVSYSLADENGDPINVVSPGQDITIKIKYEAKELLKKVNIAFNLYEYEYEGQVLLNFNTEDIGKEFAKLNHSGEFRCRIPYFPLKNGIYFGNLFCTENGSVADWIRPGLQIVVESHDLYGTGRLISQSKFITKYDWNLE